MSPFLSCPQLVKNPDLVKHVDYARFSRLHPEGRRLIRHWFRRAWESRDTDPERSFEPFIYTWFAFNGWAACVTDMDRDSEWRQALSITPALWETFNELSHSPVSNVSSSAHLFYKLWPIFKSSEIRHHEAFYSGPIDRTMIVQHYFDSGIQVFEPRCWAGHIENAEDIPLDWPHTLAVLYRVRCNLFHGEKGVHSHMDREIVYSAYQLLVNFIHDAELFY